MLWLYLSLGCALSLSIADALSKIALKNWHEYSIVFIRNLMSIPFLVIMLVIWGNIPQLSIYFWKVFLVLQPLEITAAILYIKAIKRSPLSLTIPFLAVTPVFIIVTEWLILGDHPNIFGVAGILLITTGSYLMNLHTLRHGILGPAKAILTERGSVYMLLVAFIFSITSVLGKIAIQHSNPLFFGVLYSTALSIEMLPLVILHKPNRGQLKNASPQLLLLGIGIFSGLMILLHNIALILTKVAYMISVKRTTLLFSVMFGWLFFKEEQITERLAGSIVMVVGIIVIGFLG
jgi:uncharacterized membrane protein